MNYETRDLEVREALSEAYNRSLEAVFDDFDAMEFEISPAVSERLSWKGCRRATKAMLTAALALIHGCVSLPQGELQLGPKIAEDMREQRSGGLASLSRGRPLYLESYAYPQMLPTGDIWAGGPLLVNLGREELSLDQMIGDLAKPDDAPVAAPIAAAPAKVAHQKAKKKRTKVPAATAQAN